MSVAQRPVLRLGICTALLALLPGCGNREHGRYRNADTPATAWHYRVHLDPALTRVDAEVCFEGPVPAELRAGKDEAAVRLLYARWQSPGAVRRLPVRDGRIQLDQSARDGCISYGVSLAENASFEAAVRRVGRDLVASPNAWLWRPERRAADVRATLALSLPSEVRALLPWPRAAGRYTLDAEAFRFDSYAAFGRFTPLESTEQGVAIEAAVLDGELAVDGAAVLRWLRASVQLAALSDGRFPRERLSALIVPSAAQHEPVAFGMIARGGAASVLLLVSKNASEPSLRADWVLPHELSHLLLPFVDREHAWLSEGFATYYQEVLRARAGTCSELAALQQLADSFRDASRQDPTASVIDESAHMQRTRNYRKVYWGGAAYWLNVDVALRRASQGHVSVDSVLAQLRQGELRPQVWTGQALIERLDALAPAPVFSQALSALRVQPFPAFEPTLLELGVRGEGASLRLDDAAPLAELRHQLFSVRD